MHPGRLFRNRLLGAARRAAAPVAQWRAARRPPEVRLAMVQRRLELLLGAMFGRPMRVVASGGTAAPAATDVVLPAVLPGAADAHERYRLLAIEQGARIVRGTRDALPADALERDLYLLLEGAAVDAQLARRAPRLGTLITRLRRAALASRPAMRRLVPQQRAVEQSVRALLGSAPDAAAPSLPCTASAAESAREAQALARRLRETPSRVAYRALPEVELWSDEVLRWRARMPWASLRDLELAPSGAVESEEDPTRDSTSSDPAQATPDAAPSARDGTPRDGRRTDDEGGRAASPDASGDDDAPEREDDVSSRDERAAAVRGTSYPEWIARYARLEPRHTTVHAAPATERDGDWARRALVEHGPLVRQVRDRFALLRARRVRLRAQRAGDELDLDACVRALVDARTGRVPSDRLYEATRETRHPLAIMVLVDVSGSTKALLPDGRTVLDVERLSLLLASEALGALGDPYAILAFSGLGRHDVRVATVKGFGEHDPEALRRRISSLEPQDNTRLGAAVRHATAQLLAQPAGRRVLLMLSDGRPNDVDRYQGSDAIADSRQAVLAARAAGVHTFCLTIDTDEAEYLPHLFGEAGYRVLAEPGQLPGALIHLVDRLLRG